MDDNLRAERADGNHHTAVDQHKSNSMETIMVAANGAELAMDTVMNCPPGRFHGSLPTDDSGCVSSRGHSRSVSQGSWGDGEGRLLPSASELLLGCDETSAWGGFQNHASLRNESGCGEANLGHIQDVCVPENCLFVSGTSSVQRMSSDGTGTGYRSPPSRGSGEIHWMRREPSAGSTISQPSTSLLVDRLLLKSQKLQEHIVHQMNLDHQRGEQHPMNGSRKDFRPGEFSPGQPMSAVQDTICASSTCSLQENHHAMTCSQEDDHSAMEWMGEKLEDALLQIKALHTENERLMSTLSDREIQISQLEDQLRKLGLGEHALSAPLKEAATLQHVLPSLRRFHVAWQGSAGVDYRASPTLTDKLSPNVDFAPSGSIIEVVHVEDDWVETIDGKWLPMWLPNFGKLLEEIEDFSQGPGSSAASNGSGTSPSLKCHGGATEDTSAGPSNSDSIRSATWGRGPSPKGSSHPSPVICPQPPAVQQQEVHRQYSETISYREPLAGNSALGSGPLLPALSSGSHIQGSLIQASQHKHSPPPVRASSMSPSSIPKSRSSRGERIAERVASAPARTRVEMEQKLHTAMGILQMYRQQHALLTDSVSNS